MRLYNWMPLLPPPPKRKQGRLPFDHPMEQTVDYLVDRMRREGKKDFLEEARQHLLGQPPEVILEVMPQLGEMTGFFELTESGDVLLAFMTLDVEGIEEKMSQSRWPRLRHFIRERMIWDRRLCMKINPRVLGPIPHWTQNCAENMISDTQDFATMCRLTDVLMEGSRFSEVIWILTMASGGGAALCDYFIEKGYPERLLERIRGSHAGLETALEGVIANDRERFVGSKRLFLDQRPAGIHETIARLAVLLAIRRGFIGPCCMDAETRDIVQVLDPRFVDCITPTLMMILHPRPRLEGDDLETVRYALWRYFVILDPDAEEYLRGIRSDLVEGGGWVANLTGVTLPVKDSREAVGWITHFVKNLPGHLRHGVMPLIESFDPKYRPFLLNLVDGEDIICFRKKRIPHPSSFWNEMNDPYAEYACYDRKRALNRLWHDILVGVNRGGFYPGDVEEFICPPNEVKRFMQLSETVRSGDRSVYEDIKWERCLSLMHTTAVVLKPCDFGYESDLQFLERKIVESGFINKRAAILWVLFSEDATWENPQGPEEKKIARFLQLYKIIPSSVSRLNIIGSIIGERIDHDCLSFAEWARDCLELARNPPPSRK